MNLRLLTVFVLSAYDFANHKDFHEMHLIDEGLKQSFLTNSDDMIYTSFDREGTAVINLTSKKYKLKVMDSFLFKANEDGNMEAYFMVEVCNDDELLHKVEKTYKEFNSFQTELDYSLRGSGIQAPALNNDLFDSLMPSSDDLFK